MILGTYCMTYCHYCQLFSILRYGVSPLLNDAGSFRMSISGPVAYSEISSKWDGLTAEVGHVTDVCI